MENNNTVKDLRKQISFMKSASHEEMYRITADALFAYFKCLTTFGFNNPKTKECFKVVKDMKKILRKEKQLLNLISKDLNNIDLKKSYEIVDELDELNDDTYLAYSDILDEIYISCEEKDKDRIVKPNKPINSLISNESYKEKVLSLVNKSTTK